MRVDEREAREDLSIFEESTRRKLSGPVVGLRVVDVYADRNNIRAIVVEDPKGSTVLFQCVYPHWKHFEMMLRIRNLFSRYNRNGCAS